MHVYIYGQASGVTAPPPPPMVAMVWSGRGGGGGWRVREWFDRLDGVLLVGGQGFTERAGILRKP